MILLSIINISRLRKWHCDRKWLIWLSEVTEWSHVRYRHSRHLTWERKLIIAIACWFLRCQSQVVRRNLRKWVRKINVIEMIEVSSLNSDDFTNQVSCILSQAFIINFCTLKLLLLKRIIMKSTKVASKNIFDRENRVVTRSYHELSWNVLCIFLFNEQLFQLLSQHQIFFNSWFMMKQLQWMKITFRRLSAYWSTCWR